ncbi:MAG: hypothetical protein HY763_07130 [Planctomycetes bacterium]|nr:hypothetical protein [Planctomycetota bacterium]
MPTISAPQILARFPDNGCSVLLPGVGTGHEPLVLASRMAGHAAVFVVGESAAAIKLAMHLWDYHEALSAGRLVFLDPADLEAELEALFIGYPGYEVPTQLLPMPQRSTVDLSDLQRRWETAGAAVVEIQRRTVDEAAAALRRRSCGPLPPVPRVALISADARPNGLDRARRIEGGLRRLGWPYQTCVPDAPQRCHIAARMRCIERSTADLVLLANGSAGRLAPLLPGGLALASWYMPDAPLGALAGEIAPGEYVFAASTAQAALLADVGAADPCVCEPGADDLFAVGGGSCAEPPPEAHRSVAVLMDVPDARADACGITLPSQRALWRALEQLIRQAVDRYEPTAAPGLLAEAERRSGVFLREVDLRERFMDFVRCRLAPAALADATATALAQNGFHVLLAGTGWAAPTTPGIEWVGPTPRGQAFGEFLRCVRCVVLPQLVADALDLLLDVIACGKPVVCRRPDIPMERDYPALAPVLAAVTMYSARRELVALGHDVLSGAPSACSTTGEAQNLVLREHTMSRRLEYLVGRVRASTGAGTRLCVPGGV